MLYSMVRGHWSWRVCALCGAAEQCRSVVLTADTARVSSLCSDRLSSSSGLFALVLAAMFPSTPGDRFTLSKLLAIAVNIAGVVGTHTQLALNGGRLLPRLRWQITIGPSFGGRTVISIEIIPVMK